MATLYISYFGAVRENCPGHPISTETVSTSTSSAAAGAAPAAAKVARITSDTAHYVTFGTGTPTATATNGFYLPANAILDVAINLDQSAARKFAAITLS